MQYFRIQSFSGLHVTDDSPNSPTNSLKTAENVLLRPAGAIQRVPVFSKLWKLNNGLQPLLQAAGYNVSFNETMVLKVVANTMTVLVAVEVVGGNLNGLGAFFIGDTSGKTPVSSAAGIDFLDTVLADINTPYGATATPVVTLLKANLEPGKRVYFSRIYDEIWIGNGVDPNLIYTPSTGQLRESGTSSVPSKPLVGSVASLPAASAVQPKVTVITAGTTSVTVGTTTTTTGTSTLTFTADPINFAGTAGHNISVRLISAGTSTAIASARTGAGTAISPFVYTLTLGTAAAQSSANAIAAFVGGDYNATGVLTATVTGNGPDANPSLSLVQTALSGGADQVTVGGHPLGVIYRFATTLFDPGPAGKGLGYEGPVGELSEEVIGDGSNDFIVTVAQKTGVDARFTHQNIWIREYLGEAYPSDPNGPFLWRKIRTVTNANGTYRITKDFTTLETSADAPSQVRVPPCTMFEFAGNRIWSSGNAAEPYRVYLSKLATETERVPEGYAVKSYIDIEGKKEEPSRPRVTALRKLESRIQVHTDRSITIIESDSLRRIVSRSDVGALNSSCLASWSRPNIPYLGADGIMYELNNTQYYRSGSLTPKAWPVMKEKLITKSLANNPDQATIIADNTNELIVICAPVNAGIMSQSLGCFILDTQSGALTGPCVAPGFVAANPTGALDGRFVGIGPSGYLYVLNLGALHSIENFYNSGPITKHLVFDSFSDADKGMPVVQVDSQGFVSYSGLYQYRRAYLAVIETQLIDLQTPNERKGFYSLEWSSVPASRCILKITMTTDDAQTKVIDMGEIGGKERYKVAFMASGNAIRIKLEAIVADDKPFVIRDLTLGYELQTNAGGFFF